MRRHHRRAFKDTGAFALCGFHATVDRQIVFEKSVEPISRGLGNVLEQLAGKAFIALGREVHFGSPAGQPLADRSEEHTSELQSLMRTSYAVFCLKKKNKQIIKE